jgi:hypothetical protein
MASTTSETNIISASKADIYSKLLAIAEKELPSDISVDDFLKSSLFGYVTESLAMIARDSAIHSSMMYKEAFLSTATMPRSVYNWAKMFGIGVAFATPAYADITVVIKSDVLDSFLGTGAPSMSSSKFSEYGSDVTSIIGSSDYGKAIVLSRSDPFMAGTTAFSLERSVVIYRGSNGDYSAKYVSTEAASTSYGDYSNPYLRIAKTSDGSIGFVIRAYQYETQESTRQITSSSFVSTRVHDFSYTGQLAGMRLTCAKGSDLSEIALDYSNLDSSSDSSPKAYYNIEGDGTVRVRFSESYVPTSGSILSFYAYSTLGANGVVSYSDQLTMSPSDETFKKLAVTAYMTDGKSFGGSDAPTISEIKRKIIDEISTRETIVTESDLNSYFLKLTSLLKTVDSGAITFAKKRDDILRRVFSASIEMRSGIDRKGNQASSGYISSAIPTNTIDVVYNSTVTPGGFPIPTGTEVVESTAYATEYDKGYKFSDSSADDFYITPFYIYVTMTPYKRVKYIYDMTNATSSLSFSSAKAMGPGMISPNSVTVKRGFSASNMQFSKSDHFEFTFSFSGNYDLSGISNPVISLKLYSSQNSYILLSLLANSNSFDSYSITSVASTTSSGVYDSTVTAKIKINSNNEFTINGDDGYGDYINLADGSKLTEDVKPEILISGTVNSSEINIGCKADDFMGLFRNLDDVISSDIEVHTQEADVVSAYAKKANMLLETWALCSDAGLQTSITPESGKYYSVTITDDGNSKITVKYDGSSYSIATVPSTIEYISISDVPVVHSSYFDTDYFQNTTSTTQNASFDYFIKQLYVYINMLRESLSKLETNTFFDLKFANTHGTSKSYSCSTTNLRLGLKIWLNSQYYGSSDLKDEIRDCVRMLVDSANAESELKVSQILAMTTAAYSDQIHHIDFLGLNGTFTQYVKALTLTSSAKAKYAKEYFNLDQRHIEDDITFGSI